MTPLSLYVLDTQALVFFLKGEAHRLGIRAFQAVTAPFAKIVVPSYAFEEIEKKFARVGKPRIKEINIPPSAALKLVLRSSNARVFARGPTVLAAEFHLRWAVGNHRLLPQQDLPVAATVMTILNSYDGGVVLISSDKELATWAKSLGVRVIWK